MMNCALPANGKLNKKRAQAPEMASGNKTDSLLENAA
jgi:hypothetical protein